MTVTIPAADTIDTGQLRQLREADPLIRILDVREGFEFETVHIPGSYNVPLDTLGEHAGDLAELNTRSCSSASREGAQLRRTAGSRRLARTRCTSSRAG